MHDEPQIPIWFFIIGALLLLYGVLIGGAGIYALVNPPEENARVALFHFHVDLWWGLLVTVMGLFYGSRFHPFRALEMTIGPPRSRALPGWLPGCPGRPADERTRLE